MNSQRRLVEASLLVDEAREHHRDVYAVRGRVVIGDQRPAVTNSLTCEWCGSKYRVHLPATSNEPVVCDFCLKDAA
jgi:formylmethanofuran dehydrogenase subunit E